MTDTVAFATQVVGVYSNSSAKTDNFLRTTNLTYEFRHSGADNHKEGSSYPSGKSAQLDYTEC